MSNSEITPNPQIIEVESEQVVEFNIVDSPQVVEVIPETLTIVQQTIVGGNSNGIVLTGNSSSQLDLNRVVMNLQNLEYADNTLRPSGISRLYMTVESTQTNEISVVAEGLVVNPDWNWTPLDPVFLSTDGYLTQISPSNAAFTRIIGYAETTNSIYFDPQPAIFSAT